MITVSLPERVRQNILSKFSFSFSQTKKKKIESNFGTPHTTHRTASVFVCDDEKIRTLKIQPIHDSVRGEREILVLDKKRGRGMLRQRDHRHSIGEITTSAIDEGQTAARDAGNPIISHRTRNIAPTHGSQKHGLTTVSTGSYERPSTQKSIEINAVRANR